MRIRLGRGRSLSALVICLALLATGCATAPETAEPDGRGNHEHTDQGVGHAGSLPQLRADVIHVFPHDRASFTQGLEIAGDTLYEGTGLHGASMLRALDPHSGRVRQQVGLPATLFGEGITVLPDRIWQLTWHDGVAIERDRRTLRELRQVSYTGEGWGLCHDGQRLVMSDGSARLRFRDPDSFALVGEITVTADGQPVSELNELECAGGHIWANVWGSDEIVRVDPASGRVTAAVDASGLLSPAERAGTDVLNGIAAIPGTDEFLLTGKYWPHVFRVRFVPVD